MVSSKYGHPDDFKPMAKIIDKFRDDKFMNRRRKQTQINSDNHRFYQRLLGTTSTFRHDLLELTNQRSLHFMKISEAGRRKRLGSNPDSNLSPIRFYPTKKNLVDNMNRSQRLYPRKEVSEPAEDSM